VAERGEVEAGGGEGGIGSVGSFGRRCRQSTGSCRGCRGLLRGCTGSAPAPATARARAPATAPARARARTQAAGETGSPALLLSLLVALVENGTLKEQERAFRELQQAEAERAEPQREGGQVGGSCSAHRTRRGITQCTQAESGELQCGGAERGELREELLRVRSGA